MTKRHLLRFYNIREVKLLENSNMLNIITLTVVLIEGMVKKFFYIVMDRLLISLFFSHIYNAESLKSVGTQEI